MGLICSDHRQPGSQVILTIDMSPNLTISMLAFGGVRVSSGVLKLFTCEVDMVARSFSSSFDCPSVLCLRVCPPGRMDCSGTRLPSGSCNHIMHEIFLPVAALRRLEWNQGSKHRLFDSLFPGSADGSYQWAGGTDGFPCCFVIGVGKGAGNITTRIDAQPCLFHQSFHFAWL